MQRALSFDSTPSLSAPLRFLLTAPAFGLAAALVLLWHGEAALVSRWSSPTLAITHLLTLGFLSMCMLGALLQILPVVLGVGIPYARVVTLVAHALLTAGTIALGTAFLWFEPVLFRLAVPLLLGGFGAFLLVGAAGVWRVRDATPILATIRFALGGLAITLGLGVAAASALGWQTAVPLLLLTDLHAGWGLLGWVFLLTAGVAYQVVPMFQSTAPYPAPLTRWLGRLLPPLLLAWTLALSAGTAAPLVKMLVLLPGVLVAGFAGYTLWLIARRKRPQVETTTRFWQLALGSLVACAVLWSLASTSTLWPAPWTARWQALFGARSPDLLLGLLFIVGFAVTVVNGMLYKIVPFLAWYHLQSSGVRAPNVRTFLPDARARIQFRLHAVALALLLAAACWPSWFARPAGAALTLSMALLWANLWRVLLLYRKTERTAPAATFAAQGIPA